MGKTTKRKRRFHFYPAHEIARMGHDKWVEECRRHGCDMQEHPEDEALREELEANAQRKR